jgi:hypothetical protein
VPGVVLDLPIPMDILLLGPRDIGSEDKPQNGDTRIDAR